MLSHSLCRPSGHLLFSDRWTFVHRGLKPTVRRIVLCCVMGDTEQLYRYNNSNNNSNNNQPTTTTNSEPVCRLTSPSNSQPQHNSHAHNRCDSHLNIKSTTTFMGKQLQ
jgi:hypothetical protein